MTTKSKKPASRSKKPKQSNLGSDIVRELLESEEDNDNLLEDEDLDLNNKFVLAQLKKKAKSGDTRALELLGKHLQLFEKSSKQEDIIDVFAEDGTIEENILHFLDVLEDKYYNELNNSIELLQNDEQLYLNDKEREMLLRQLEEQHQKNVQLDTDYPLDDITIDEKPISEEYNPNTDLNNLEDKTEPTQTSSLFLKY